MSLFDECKILRRQVIEACIIRARSLEIPDGIVCTEYPLEGTGESDNCIRLVDGERCSDHLQWCPIQGRWVVTRSPGITEVTAGPDTGKYPTVQAAIDAGCCFIRVVDTFTEPAPLNLCPDTIIYVDPGITYSMANGQMDVQGRSLTLMGSASNGSSALVSPGQYLLDTNSRLYFHDLHVTNNTSGSLITTGTGDYGKVLARHSTFVAAEQADPSLFGEPGAPAIKLEIHGCTIEGRGSSNTIVFTRDQLVMICGLVFEGTFGTPMVSLATEGANVTNVEVPQAVISDWLIQGQMNNLHAEGVTLVFEGSALMDNCHIRTYNAVNGSNNILNNFKVMVDTVSGGGTLKISNTHYFGNLTINTSNDQQYNNIVVVRNVLIQSSSNQIENLQCGAVLIDGSRDNFIDNMQCTRLEINNGALFNQICNSGSPFAPLLVLGVSNSNFFDTCNFRSVQITDTQGTRFDGGQYGDVTITNSRGTYFIGTRLTSVVDDANCVELFVGDSELNSATISCTRPHFDNCRFATGLTFAAGSLVEPILVSNCRLIAGSMALGGFPASVSNCVVGTGGTGFTITGAGGATVIGCWTDAVMPTPPAIGAALNVVF